MVQLDEMLDRLDMESLVFRLMYGTIYNGGYTGSYEDRINSAYEKFMEEIKQHNSSDAIDVRRNAEQDSHNLCGYIF